MKNGYTIFDAHAHVFPNKIAERATSSISVFYDDMPMQHIGSMEQLLKSGANAGIDGYLICSTATNVAQVQAINQFLWDSCKDHVNCIAFAAMHPFAPDCQADMDFILQHGFRGIKLHPDFQKFYIDDPAVYPLYEIIQETQLPILMHMGAPHQTYSQPQRLAKVLKEFPKLRVSAAHLGGWERWEEAVANLKADERLRFDTSSCSPFLPKDKMREIIRHYGAENCFFGVDFPMWDHEEELERFFALSLTDYENKRILSENLIEWIHQTNKK